VRGATVKQINEVTLHSKRAPDNTTYTFCFFLSFKSDSLFQLPFIYLLKTEKYYKFLKSREQPEGKRPLGRSSRRWVDNIKRILREIGWDEVEWIDIAQDRDQWMNLVNTILNLRIP
jgi:hypothetical protein